jgi:hypothetical protein
MRLLRVRTIEQERNPQNIRKLRLSPQLYRKKTGFSDIKIYTIEDNDKHRPFKNNMKQLQDNNTGDAHQRNLNIKIPFTVFSVIFLIIRSNDSIQMQWGSQT